MEIEIPIEPVAQGRPRFRRIGGGVATYDPPKSKEFKKYVRALAESNRIYFAEQHVSILVELIFYLPMLKSFSNKKRLAAIEGNLRPSKKPDIDNYIKGTLDALNGIYWHDDGQIVDIHASKYYSENPRIELKITEV